MAKLYGPTYKKQGVKTLSDLHTKVFLLRDFVMPSNTILHYFPMNSEVLMNGDAILTSSKGKAIYVRNLGKLQSLLGSPTYRNRLRDFDRSYFKRNKRFIRLKTEIEKVPSQAMIVLNYGSLIPNYKYKGTDAIRRTNGWYNIIKTLVSQIEEGLRADKNSLIVVQVPSAVLEKELIKKLVGKDLKTVSRFIENGTDFFYFYLLNMAIGEAGILSNFSDDTLARTSIVIQNGNKGMQISLAYLSMIKPDDVHDTLIKHDVVKASGIKDLSVSNPTTVLINSIRSVGVVKKTEVLPSKEEKIEEEDIDEIAYQIENVEVVDITKEVSSDTALQKEIDMLADSSEITAAVYKSVMKDVESAKDLSNPYNKEEKLSDTLSKERSINIDEHDPVLAMVDVPDKSMLRASVDAKTKSYVKNHLSAHKLAMVDMLKAGGVIITKYDVEVKSNILGAYEVHELSTRMVGGGNSKIIFRVPVINEDGIFRVNDTEYVLKTQKSERPITKTTKDKVVLSTYYHSKIMVSRSDLLSLSVERRVAKLLMALPDNRYISMNMHDGSLKLPYMYGVLASNFKTYSVSDINLNMSYRDRLSDVFNGDKDRLRELEKGNRVGIGRYTNGDIILIDNKDVFYRVTKKETVKIGDISDLFGLPLAKSLYDMAETKLMGKRVAVGVVLGYLLGLSSLIKLIGLEYEIVPRKQRVSLENNAFPPILFNDVKLIVKNPTITQSLIMYAFIYNESTIKEYDYKLFDGKDVWLNVILDRGGSIRILDEVDLQSKMFIDPISKDILKLMNEPVTYPALMLRAVELLKDNRHKEPSDASTKLFKGYERIPGLIYSKLTRALREANSRTNMKRRKIEMTPHDIWNTILQDPGKEFFKSSNPTQELKTKETGSLGGAGGRTKRTVTTKDRTFDKGDIGVVSEATPDSSEVGSTFLLTPGAQFANVYGMIKEEETTISEPGSILSTPALTSYGVQYDDPKRVMMISVQASHVININEGEEPYVKTGYEKVIVARSSDKFAMTAKEKGIVIDVSEFGIKLRYTSGTEVGVKLGFQSAKSEGLFYPFETVTDLKVGDKFKVGDLIAYNESFISKKGKSVNDSAIKDSVSARIALVEDTFTFEDSSGVSKEFAKKLNSNVLSKKSYTIESSKEIHHLVKIGDWVEPDSPLFIIEDELSSTIDKDDILNALDALSTSVPTAKVSGEVMDIVILYHGGKEDMSPSVLKAVKQSDRRLGKKAQAVNNERTSGEVDSEYRIEGKPLQVNNIEIILYVKSVDEYGEADKMVFGHQMKTTTSDIMDFTLTDEDDNALDGFFSKEAIDARMVTSALRIATTTSLLKALPMKLQELLNK